MALPHKILRAKVVVGFAVDSSKLDGLVTKRKKHGYGVFSHKAFP